MISRRFSIRKIFATAIIVCLLAGIAALTLVVTKIRQIQVTGLPADITFDSRKIPQSLLLFPVERVKQIILREYPYIQDVAIKKEYPSTLKIFLTPRSPVAIVASVNRKLYIAKDGMLLGDVSLITHPVIQVEDLFIRPGLIVEHQGIRESLAFLSEMSQDENIQLLELPKEEKVIRVATPMYTVLLSQEKNGIESARTLQSVLTGFRIKGQIPQQIDLRFDQPVVK